MGVSDWFALTDAAKQLHEKFRSVFWLEADFVKDVPGIFEEIS